MKLEKPKGLLVLWITVFFLFVFFFALSLFLWNGGAFWTAFTQHRPSFSVLAGDETVLAAEEWNTLPPGSTKLLVKNGQSEEVSFTFYAGGSFLGSITLPPKGTGTIHVFLEAESPLSLYLSGEGISCAFFTDETSVSFITDAMKEGGDLFFLGDVNLQEIFLFAPFRFFGSFSFSSLNLETERAGKIVISPWENFTASVLIHAPECRVFYRDFTPDFEKHMQDFFVKAKGLNGKKLDPSHFPIETFEQLSRLSSDDLLPRIAENAEIVFFQSFSLSESLSFAGHFRLTFSVPIEFGEYTLSFSSSEEGEYRVKTPVESGILAQNLLFFAPRSSLVWESEGAVPQRSIVEKRSNLSSYNGKKTLLGGEGTALPTLFLSAEENSFLSEDVCFLPQGNVLSATLPFPVARADLNDAVYSLTVQAGSAHVEGDLSGGVILSVDEEGRERRFALEILRKEQNIPIVYLETENGQEITSKSQYVSATFSMSAENTSYSSVGETNIRIRGRGNSTWKWEKKPYKIHFDEKTSLFGLASAEEWALFANYADKSLIRNRLAQVMAKTLSFSYCPELVSVDVFLNGEYIGIYSLGEHLEEGEGRVRVSHDMSQIDCGYFLEAGGVVSGVDVKGMNYFHAGLVKFVLIKGPEYNTLTSEQFGFIKDYMLAADAAVKKGEGYEEYLDMESVIDWLIMIELTNNTDCAWRRSTYFTKDPGEKLKMGPVWDFDLAFGNFSKDVEGFDVWVSTSEDDYVGETWSTYFLEDPAFRARFKARWNEVRDTLLQVAFDEIETSYELLSPSAVYNFTRWDILGKKVAFERQDTKKYKTYESQMEYLKDFLQDRARFIDKQVENW